MCECIEKLVKKGFIRKDSVGWNEELKDFTDTPAQFKIHAIARKDYYFKINYCPACGERLTIK